MNLAQLITLHGRYWTHHPAIVERARSFTFHRLDRHVAAMPCCAAAPTRS
jgi:hypothetical protein